MTYGEGDANEELLSVEDLKAYSSIARFQHSLHVGDVVEYTRYLSASDSTTVVATIYEIGDSIYRDEKIGIRTSLPYAALTFSNSAFKIVDSEHNDAPPQDEWTSLDEVNLVRGKIDEVTEARNTEERKNRLNEVIDNTPGGEIARLLVKGEVLKRNDKRTHSITSGNQFEYRYAIGTMVKKEWDGKSYSGEVVNRGLDGEKKTYEIYYSVSNSCLKLW